MSLWKSRRPDSAASTYEEAQSIRSDADVLEAGNLLRAWMAVRVECLQGDGADLRSGGDFTSLLAPDVAARMGQSSRDLNVIAHRLPADLREAVADLTSASDAIFDEQAARPSTVNREWLLAQLADLKALYDGALSLMPESVEGSAPEA